MTVEGFHFEPNTAGPLNFIPPSGVSLTMANIETDDDGPFRRRPRGLPQPPDRGHPDRPRGDPPERWRAALQPNATETWNKIIETVFLALLATTFGHRYCGAAQLFCRAQPDEGRHGTADKRGPDDHCLAAGLALGALRGPLAGRLGQRFRPLATHLGGLIVGPTVMWLARGGRCRRPKPRRPARCCAWRGWGPLALAVVAGILALFLFTRAARPLGPDLKPAWGPGLPGRVLSDLGDILACSLRR